MTKKELIAQAIAKCADNRGRIRPEAVVKAARDEGSILHGEFEWDVKIAAEQYWLNRARELIREVKLEFVHDKVTLVAPYYVHDVEDDKSAYIPAIRVAKKKVNARETINDELKRIKAAIHRAKNLSALFGLKTYFDDLLRITTEVEIMIGEEE